MKRLTDEQLIVWLRACPPALLKQGRMALSAQFMDNRTRDWWTGSMGFLIA